MNFIGVGYLIGFAVGITLGVAIGRMRKPANEKEEKLQDTVFASTAALLILGAATYYVIHC
jgi:prolipoprotein diacylglyceryltransferase